MDTPIYTLSLWIARALTLVLLLYAGLFCYRPYQPRYLRSFPLYCLVNLLAEGMAMQFPDEMGLIYNLFGCFELVYFAYFLTGITGGAWLSRLVWVLVGAGVVFLSWFLAAKDRREPNLVAFVGESLILSIPCFTYFHEIFLTKRVLSLLDEPSFWMVTGVLFYMLLRIPAMLFTAYFGYQGAPILQREIFAVNNYALSITYILFIKAMTCLTKRYS